MQSSVTFLPESDDRTVCVRATGLINAEDFQRNFVAPVMAAIAKHGQVHVYVIYSDDFQGWDPQAAEASFKTYAEFGPFGRRCAYVNVPDSLHLTLKMMRPLMPGADIRFFEKDEADKAMAWVKGTS